MKVTDCQLDHGQLFFLVTNRKSSKVRFWSKQMTEYAKNYIFNEGQLDPSNFRRDTTAGLGEIGAPLCPFPELNDFAAKSNFKYLEN